MGEDLFFGLNSATGGVLQVMDLVLEVLLSLPKSLRDGGVGAQRGGIINAVRVGAVTDECVGSAVQLALPADTAWLGSLRCDLALACGVLGVPAALFQIGLFFLNVVKHVAQGVLLGRIVLLAGEVVLTSNKSLALCAGRRHGRWWC